MVEWAKVVIGVKAFIRLKGSQGSLHVVTVHRIDAANAQFFSLGQPPGTGDSQGLFPVGVTVAVVTHLIVGVPQVHVGHCEIRIFCDRLIQHADRFGQPVRGLQLLRLHEQLQRFPGRCSDVLRRAVGLGDVVLGFTRLPADPARGVLDRVEQRLFAGGIERSPPVRRVGGGVAAHFLNIDFQRVAVGHRR